LPTDIAQFAALWKPPTPFHQGKCTAAQIKLLVSCDFDTYANDPACKGALTDPANQGCQNCLATPSTASVQGPIVTDGQYAFLNIAGCIANAEGNASTTSCGAKFEFANQCSESACSGCPDTDLNERDACVAKAAASVCAAYEADADCADALLSADGPAAACMQGDTFLESAAILGNLFCGN
jgi:hypothetical protein